MVLLSVKDGHMEFAEDVLFDGLNFLVEDNAKIGLVGSNGAGKTTLFEILSGERVLDDGEIFVHKNTKIGYMRQNIEHKSKLTVWQELMQNFSALIKIEEDLSELSKKIEQKQGDVTELVARQEELMRRYEREDGFLYKSKARGALIGLGFSEDDFEKSYATLSGGQKTRVCLAKLLLSSSNLLLLDEPTNHLDIKSVEWLEGFLKSYNGAFIVISHDRYFLDKVTNKTMGIDNKKLDVYDGNYTTFIKKRDANRIAKQREYEKTKKEIERLEGIIQNQKRWNREKNIKTAESKQKIVDKLRETLEKPEQNTQSLRLSFSASNTGGNDVLLGTNLSKAFGDNKLFCDTTIDIKSGERVFILGANGCGKTTLLKILNEEMMPDTGEVVLGARIKKGYYDQIQQGLSQDKTIMQEISDAFPKMTNTEIRNALARFLFKNDEVLKKISVLSGGEKARVLMLKLMLSEANLLILDEPTNHLDLESKEALEKALAEYDGTLLIVSHDRYFINALADKIYFMDDGFTKCYVGDYDYFLEKSRVITDTEVKQPQSTGAIAYQEKKQIQAQIRKLNGQVSRAEEKITALEKEIEALTNEMFLPEISVDYTKCQKLQQQIDTDKALLDEQYKIWEQASRELSELE